MKPYIRHYLLGGGVRGRRLCIHPIFTPVATWVGDLEENECQFKGGEFLAPNGDGKIDLGKPTKINLKVKTMKGWSCAHRDFQRCPMKHISKATSFVKVGRAFFREKMGTNLVVIS